MNKGFAMEDRIDVLDEEKEVKLEDIAEVSSDGVVWIWDMKDPALIDAMRLFIRKWVDSIENFAQYIMRRMQKSGLIMEFSSSITPTKDGYTMTMNFRLRGIRADVLRKKWRLIKMHIQDRTTTMYKYRRAQQILERLQQVGDEYGGGDKDTPTQDSS